MANQVAYGFMNLRDVFARRVTEVGVDVVATARDQSLAEHNRQLDALLALFVRRTTGFKTKFKSTSVARLQPLDEFGRALPIKPSGQYEVAFPIQMGGAAWGANWLAREKMTVEEANDATIMLQEADVRWVRDHILGGLLYNGAGWVFNDPEHGNLTVLGLANGDTQPYMVLSGADQNATDSHYLAQAAAIADANNPFGAIYTELTEHPENGGTAAQVIALVASNLVTDIRNLTSFYAAADPNLAVGTGVTQLQGGPGVSVPGRLIGYVAEKVWIAEWPQIPSGYMVATTTQGDRPLSMREDEEANLRGFKQVAERADHPWWEAQYVRRAGFGAWNRVGAVVQRIGNGAYAIPTGYESPMP